MKFSLKDNNTRAMEESIRHVRKVIPREEDVSWKVIGSNPNTDKLTQS